MKKNDKLIMNISLVLAGAILFIINYLFSISEILYLVGVVLVVIGPVITEYERYKRNKDIELHFPDFLRDVSENINAGMTLPRAIRATKDTNYGLLTPFVKKMAIQIDWGISFDDILENFAAHESPIIKRTVSTIIETHRSGGRIKDIIKGVGKNIIQVNKIRKERYSSIYSQMITGYIIFFVFIGIMVSLKSYLLPSLFVIGSPELGITMTAEEITTTYSDIFKWLVLIQGFFSGLVIGKMTEGSIISGLKHCLILIIVGYGTLLFF